MTIRIKNLIRAKKQILVAYHFTSFLPPLNFALLFVVLSAFVPKPPFKVLFVIGDYLGISISKGAIPMEKPQREHCGLERPEVRRNLAAGIIP